ncbi:MAG: Ni/Fe hydrogenase subunit alpha [Myxococcota bacterium]
MAEERTKTITVEALARVEGEGALHVRMRGDAVEEVRLEIFEPPRFFEALLRGRAFVEAPDITSRICGICPIAYQMSAVHALERALGVEVPTGIRDLRRLIYCGEWIASHALHVTMLHAPDFLGYAGGIEMSRDHPEAVRRGLALKKAGNALMAVLGGREIHPINVRVGGFYRLPRNAELRTLRETAVRARDLALETLRWAGTFDFPDLERDYEFVSLRHPGEYPMNEGRLISSGGVDIPVDAWDAHFEERQVPHSTALHAVRRGHGLIFLGPMARYHLNADRLPGWIRDEARAAGADEACRNPYRSILVRCAEMLYAADEAVRILDGWQRPDAPAVEVAPRAAVGWGATEAPRGTLLHRYEIDDAGTILDARIIPPTSQNQGVIEEDVRRVVEAHGASMPDDDLQWRCEQTIRNYDPCISCATHFLTLDVERLDP